jgi:hypothetical protein
MPASVDNMEEAPMQPSPELFDTPSPFSAGNLSNCSTSAGTSSFVRFVLDRSITSKVG